MPSLDDLCVEIDADGMDCGLMPDGFAIRSNRYMRKFHAAKAEDKARRVRVKRFIHPDNAREMVEQMPQPGESLHSVIRGDFVLCDILPMICARLGRPCGMWIATLGMSRRNAETLRELMRSGAVHSLRVLVSHYFAGVDKAGTFREVSDILGADRITVARTHAKVFLISAAPDFYVIEGSANLRSSDNLEQVTIHNDSELHDFHAEWMMEVAANA